MKPGPATSTSAIRSSARSLSATSSASWRGFLSAGLASTIATLLAMSPWVGSRGGSTTTRDASSAGNAPAAVSAASAACTRPSTFAKIFWSGSDIGRALSQVPADKSKRGQLCRKQPSVLLQRKAVGHSGNEISDLTRAPGGIERVEPFAPLGRHVLRRHEIAREQIAHHDLRLFHYADHARVAIHVGPEEVLEGAVGPGHQGGKADHHCARGAYLVG